MKVRRMFATVVVLAFALVLAGSAAAAQMRPPSQKESAPMQSPPAQPGATDAKEIQGTIKSFDRAKSTLTLEDGTTLTVPRSVQVAPSALKKGAKLSAKYEEQDGKKVVTSLRVEPASKS